MKILLVDTWTTGHHDSLALGVIKACSGNEVYMVYPKILSEDIKKTYLFYSEKQHLSFWEYLKLLRLVADIAKKIKPDIIHFLTWDYILRFFGISMSNLSKKYRIITTLHNFQSNYLKNAALFRASKRLEMILVHTKKLQKKMKSLHIKNARVITYPFLGTVSCCDVEKIKEKYNLPRNVKLLGYFGSSRYDKGLDLLLAALKGIKGGYGFIIAGMPDYFSQDYIVESVSDLRNTVLFLKNISNQEWNEMLHAVDIIVLPYRPTSIGASGILAEAAANRKMVIGSDCGFLGEAIKKFSLGFTFATEDIKDLRNVIQKALKSDFNINADYERFILKTSLENFCTNYKKLVGIEI